MSPIKARNQEEADDIAQELIEDGDGIEYIEKEIKLI